MTNEITHILQSIEQGDSDATEKLLAIVYNELRQIAARKMAAERPGQTLQPTALVHDAWLRLLGPDGNVHFQNRAHFFSAAAKAMRRILVERAKRRQTREAKGFVERVELDDSAIVLAAPDAELLAVHEWLDQLKAEDPAAAELVSLRYFVGMNMEETADILGLSKRAAEEIWTFARAWLRQRLKT